jgi:hypothetical protein
MRDAQNIARDRAVSSWKRGSSVKEPKIVLLDLKICDIICIYNFIGLQMKNLIISQSVLDHIWDKHQLRRVDVEECFFNHFEPKYIEDDRTKNKTNPPTYWFISENHQSIKLKVVCVFKDGRVFLKTAYPPNEVELSIYNNSK